MGRRRKDNSLEGQVIRMLRSQVQFGVSKHNVLKPAEREKRIAAGEKINSARAEGIAGYKTLNTYIQHCTKFANWVKENHPEVRRLTEAKAHVSEYLNELLKKHSPYSLPGYRSALRKMYKDITVGENVKLPKREYEARTRSRGQKPSDIHFNRERHADIVQFCQATGLRKSCLVNFQPADVVKMENGQLVIAVYNKKDPETGKTLPGGPKGGKNYIAIVAKDMEDAVLTFTQNCDPDDFVFMNYPGLSHYDAHAERHNYAKTLYKEITGQECDKKHFDKDALKIISRSMGHERLSVVKEYLRSTV